MSTSIRSAPRSAALSAFAVFTALSIFAGPVAAERKERQGQEVVDAVRGACHRSGKDNAPRIGDANAEVRRPGVPGTKVATFDFKAP